MALARLTLKNIQSRVIPSFSSSSSYVSSSRIVSGLENHDFGVSEEMMMVRGFSTDDKSKAGEITVNQTEGEGRRKKSKLFPLSQRGKGGGLWRNNKPRDVAPFDLQYLFPSGLGDALVQASENFNRLLENLTPYRLLGRVKEKDDCYKLKYQVPGLAKEDIKITVEDGVLTIKGEHKEIEEDGSDDEHWNYGYYSTTLLLPDDAKVDEVKAEMKDGVLNIIIPKTEKPKKEVKEVQIN